MNTERAYCGCGNPLLRISTQAHDTRLPLGYFCNKCGALLNLDKQYLVPIDLILRLDPALDMVPRIDAYRAILDTRDKLIDTTSRSARVGESKVLSIDARCRAPGNHERGL